VADGKPGGDGVDSDVGNWNVEADAGFSFSNSSSSSSSSESLPASPFFHRSRALEDGWTPKPIGLQELMALAPTRRSCRAPSSASSRPRTVLLPQPESHGKWQPLEDTGALRARNLESRLPELRVDAGCGAAPTSRRSRQAARAQAAGPAAVERRRDAFVLDLRGPQFRAALHARGRPAGRLNSSTRTRFVKTAGSRALHADRSRGRRRGLAFAMARWISGHGALRRQPRPTAARKLWRCGRAQPPDRDRLEPAWPSVGKSECDTEMAGIKCAVRRSRRDTPIRSPPRQHPRAGAAT